MALQAAEIATSIAGLSISGMKSLRDLDRIPETVSARECPILYPRPDNWITNMRVERNSYGSGSQARFTLRYTLNYVYLHSPISTGRSLFSEYKAMVQQVLLILAALLATDAPGGVVDLLPQNVPMFDPVVDPAGNFFHGCVIAIDIAELVN
jgi:hypothetical protein